MKKLTLLFILFLGSANAEVYRWVDENGNVIFSDEPEAGSEKIELSPATVYSSENVELVNQTPSSEETTSPEVLPNYLVSIISPSNNEAIWSNDGLVTISVLVEPAANTEKGERVSVSLAGETKLAELGSTSVQFENISRGTHTATATVVSADGVSLAPQTSVQFHIHRASVNN